MERWQFIQSPAGDWDRLCSDVITHKTRTSTATFKTKTQCMTDAMTNGCHKLGAQCTPATDTGAQRRGRGKPGARRKSGQRQAGP